MRNLLYTFLVFENTVVEKKALSEFKLLIAKNSFSASFCQNFPDDNSKCGITFLRFIYYCLYDAQFNNLVN